MPSKYQFYRNIAEQAAHDVVRNRSDWMEFLDTAAKMYKYPFPDQLMIYAQRPDAIACAPIELWNEKFDRWVQRGSKGIALIDDTGSYPRLKYVFDVNDTEPSRYNARPVQLWTMREEHQAPVLKSFAKSYDGVGISFVDTFRNIAKQLAAEYYNDNAREIRYASEDSFLAPDTAYDFAETRLEEYDDTHLRAVFEDVLANSIAYTLMSRCGFDTAEHFNDDDFSELYSFNTPNMVYALGTATSELSEQVLRDIELTIKKYERQHAAERSQQNERNNQVHSERGLSSAGHQVGRAAEGTDRTAGTVRPPAESVSERIPDDNVQHPAAVREAVPPSSGNRGIGGGEAVASDERVDDGEHPARQTERPDGLDSGDERTESTGGGNGDDRVSLRLNQELPPPESPQTEQAQPEPPPEQDGGSALSETKPPTDSSSGLLDGKAADTSALVSASQVGNTSILQTISTSSITLDEVDSILRDGGNGFRNSKESVLRIAAHFAKNLPLEDNAAFLRREYLRGRFGREETPGGKGYQFGTQPTAVWFDENGITIGRGQSAISARDFAVIPWEQAAERVKALYDAGMFVSHDVLDEALHNESCERADDVVEVYKNLTRGISDLQWELKKSMTKEQKEALEGDWRNHRYLIRGLAELEKTVLEALEGKNKTSPDEAMRLYNETIRLSNPIPEEWGFAQCHPEIDERMTELLRDKSEYSIILNRLREDVAELKDTPDVPLHLWRNPYQVLRDLEKAGLPAHGFPAAEYESLKFMRFITDDEIDSYLLRGGAYSEGKMRMFSHFLHNHTPKETEKFLKDSYGHGGGTWIDGWSNAEPGKGIKLQRPGCDDVNMKWGKVAKRISELVHSGRFMSRAELERIPDYEIIMLARTIQNFYHNLDEYTPPFEDNLDFHYPKEAEREAIRSFLNDSEQVERILGEMRYIYANTAEDDRYYDTRKAGYEQLLTYSEGTYTLFPGLDKLPDPELALRHGRQSTPEQSSPPAGQITLFDIGMQDPTAESPVPVLPSVTEQQAVIERKQEHEQTVEVEPSAVDVLSDIDNVLLNISDTEKDLIAEQFAENPRSREAVQLVREIYGDNLPIPLPQAIKRITELAAERKFVADTDVFALFEHVREELSERGFTASGELVEEGISEYNARGGKGNFQDVADFIEDEYLTEEPELEHDTPQSEAEKPNILQECERIKTENDGAIVMWQVGDFFEMYNEDAKTAATTLNVAMTQRLWSGEPQAGLLVGIPRHTLGDNLRKLNEAGYSVAVSSVGADGERDIAIHNAGKPAPEFDFDSIAEEIYEQVLNDGEFAEVLANATSRGALRRPLNAVLDAVIAGYESEQQMFEYLSNNDIADNLFDFIYRKAWDERQTTDIQPEVQQPELQAPFVPAKPDNPPPIFFVDWDSAQHDIDMNLYKDRDIIGYNKDGVEYKFGKMGDFVYTTQTSMITPWGQTLGADGIPPDIWEQMNAYRNGELTENQVQENYLRVLEDYKNPEAVAVEWERAEPIQTQQPSKPQSAANFRITDDHLGEGGAKTKFRNNMDAINALNNIEFEKRTATPAEQEILSRYVGWGGLPQAFDPDNKQWEDEYLELNMALSPEEWESARASTPNAHYTTPTVIKAVYEAIERMGFTSGNILEPSCGVGNFFGLLPENMKNSKLYGVELDSVTARIAKQLYPKANIKHTGFEQTDTPDAFFDLAIGNVPFGNYGVSDKRYDKHNFSIHNYFFAKALDQVRPGGVIAFLTSKYMMDEKNPAVRKYLAHRAELLGAVRLPNNAFLKNAGTETTIDIIFLQKRDRPIDIEPDWVGLDQLTVDNGQLTIPVNSYFVQNPEMILGTMALDERMNNKYGRDNITTCIPTEGADLAEQLKSAIIHVKGEYEEPDLDDIDGVDNHSIPADSGVKNFSYALVTLTDEPDLDSGELHAAKLGVGDVYFRENSRMYPVDLPATTLERIKGMCTLRDCVQRLIQLQLENASDDEIKEQQSELDYLYDRFTAEFGLINSTANSRAFNADSAYYLLCSLEILDEDGYLESKADMFTKRTIKQKTVITHVDTASEALAVSLGEKARVDLAYMSQLADKDEQTLFDELRGVIFKTTKGDYQTADEFLSGNVREKLRLYKMFADDTEIDGHLRQIYRDNVTALTAVQPKDLEAPEISVRLGSTWIEPEYVNQFMQHLFKTPWRMQEAYQVKYHPYTGEWQITSKGRALYNDITATVTYGTTRMNAYEILHDTLNLRDVRVYDYIKDNDGNEKRVLNKKETTLAQQKQEQIKQAFKDWLWQDPERRQHLVRKYNDLFNSTRPREYDGSHISFSGISPEITMRPHQLNAIARILYGGNTLLAHVVGAGKTFEMVGAAMEGKRVGLCHKSLFAVPNHLTEQWAGEFLRLYPSANILVATKKDFEMRNRRKFCAKIATGDYDAVIIGHTQLEKIPMSKERQERLIWEQLEEIEEGIEELKRSNGERFSIKQLEKTKKSLEARLRKLLDAKQKDDVVTFEQLGVDRLFVDEAHSFKNRAKRCTTSCA